MKTSWGYGRNVSVPGLDAGVRGPGLWSEWDLYGPNVSKPDQGPGLFTIWDVE